MKDWGGKRKYFMNKSTRLWYTVDWCALQLRTILAILSFYIYPKKRQCFLAQRHHWPKSDFAENQCLSRSKFNSSRPILCHFSYKPWDEKPLNFWSSLRPGNSKLYQNWVSASLTIFNKFSKLTHTLVRKMKKLLSNNFKVNP